jgi:hypothetical protein
LKSQAEVARRRQRLLLRDYKRKEAGRLTPFSSNLASYSIP